MHEFTKEFIRQEYTFINALSQDHKTVLVSAGENAQLYVKKTVDEKTAALYQKLRDKNICGLARIAEVIEDGDNSVVITEFINGLPLDKKIERDGVVPVKEARKYMLTLCQCVKQLHGEGIIHRDITASNIIIGQDGCYLIDLGIAREKKKMQHSDTQILGTVGYAAPEQFGFEQTDERTDIYALGTVFHFMLTGVLPGEQSYSGREKQIIKKCIEIDRKKRYQNISELQRALLGKDRKKRMQATVFVFIVVCIIAVSLCYSYHLLKRQNWMPLTTPAASPASATVPSTINVPDDIDANVGTKTMTRERYHQIQTGMTYEEVVRLAGTPSYKNSDVENMGIHYQIYTWTGDNALSNAVISFQNGQVVGKAQSGLR